ncbi:major facilitator superfamily domain-containing protein [Phyllosticta citrichinensis]|uniref:Major facilitator superfamily domain-containing protein n=1 Tax=Phyllosticta citrichinensis TaxID=1130410 RepID=A0ABR1XMA8_9PEZI
MPRLRDLGGRVLTELGLRTVLACPRDVYIIYTTRFLRMAAYGGVALILALFFERLSIPDARIGLFMTLTLLGDVAISLLLTLVADALGRRRTLLLGSVCMALAGIFFSVSSNYWVLLVGAVVGVISVSGNEIGPFRAVEESTLAQLVAPDARADVFVWYVVVGTLGTALGASGCGLFVEHIKSFSGWNELSAFRAVFNLYGVIGLLKGALTLLLSTKCEVDAVKPAQAEEGEEAEQEGFLMQDRAADDNDDDNTTNEQHEGRPNTSPPPPPPKKANPITSLSPSTRATLLKLCSLFLIDSLASGMVPYSLINFFLDRKFHTRKSTLGTIASSAWFASSIGNAFASPLSRRIGLVRTMAFTHLPSALFLALFPAPRGLRASAALLVARALLASMDQAPRSAFLSAVVLPNERTAVMGIVNVVKTLSQSAGPSLTGLLAAGRRFWVAFVVAGALKAAYDVGLLVFFVRTRLEGDGRRNNGARDSVSESDSDADSLASLVEAPKFAAGALSDEDDDDARFVGAADGREGGVSVGVSGAAAKAGAVGER